MTQFSTPNNSQNTQKGSNAMSREPTYTLRADAINAPTPALEYLDGPIMRAQEVLTRLEGAVIDLRNATYVLRGSDLNAAVEKSVAPPRADFAVRSDAINFLSDILNQADREVAKINDLLRVLRVGWE